jgi:hypothetical protein
MRHLLLLAVILTDWGTFTCSAIDCAQVSRAGLHVYWFAPTLAVTRDHVPILTRICNPVPTRAHTWDCRSGDHPQRRAVEWAPESWFGPPQDR